MSTSDHLPVTADDYLTHSSCPARRAEKAERLNVVMRAHGVGRVEAAQLLARWADSGSLVAMLTLAYAVAS